MMKEIHLLGVSFRTAPIAVREGLSYSRAEAQDLLREAVSAAPSLEAMVLSTCNRTEFYLAASEDEDVVSSWLQRLIQSRPSAPILHSECSRFRRTGASAVRHLLRVASGLDSGVLGDSQILGQVKGALAAAAECGAIGATLQEAVHSAIRAGKRARAETAIGRGAASVGSVLASLVLEKRHLPPVTAPLQILIIGAGDTASDAARHLAKHRAGEMTVVNRSRHRAERLAESCGAHVVDWDDLESAIGNADVVIAATSSKTPVLTREMLRAQAARSPRRLIIDAGSPRNVEADSSVEVIDIDGLQEHRDFTMADRLAAVPAVEAIVEQEFEAWQQWQSSRPVENLLKKLYQDAALMSREAAMSLAQTTPISCDQAERVLMRSFKRILHGHAESLRRQCFSKAPKSAAPFSNTVLEVESARPRY